MHAIQARAPFFAALACCLSNFLSDACAADSAPQIPDATRVEWRWGIEIPMRDGVRLSAILYRPTNATAPSPCIFSMTPYTAQLGHARGMDFASRGLTFLMADTRGRGNSQGVFKPFADEARDGYDIAEWLAKQPYCNGKVAMSGGSYGGFVQWATARERPPHLMTIVPAASVYPGLDFPMFNNITYPYVMQWLTYVSGRTLQSSVFDDSSFWIAVDRRWYESGAPFRQLDRLVGNPSATFQEWVAHPYLDEYWDALAPSAKQYANLDIPILTITGSYDDDQYGALSYYRRHAAHASPAAHAKHYLVIGPWDHAGTRVPKTEFMGIKVGDASLVDLQKLHADWYAWTMQDGPKPAFLAKRVAYYVMGADRWRYADTLDGVTARHQPLWLDSEINATDVFRAGSLQLARGDGAPDHFVHDPRDTSSSPLVPLPEEAPLIDQRRVVADTGKQLVYHSVPFASDTEISGFFRLYAWIAIDQPDMDFEVSVYEIRLDGGSTLLASDLLRARYRESLREPKLIRTTAPLRYDFEHFPFISTQVKKGSRLRLTLRPLNSFTSQKNYNSGKEISDESMQDARSVTVRLFHDAEHPSALYVPLGQPNDAT
jgi:putative CocE/NonD family hydrolase